MLSPCQKSKTINFKLESMPKNSLKTKKFAKESKNIKKIKASEHLFESDSDPKLNFYYQLLTQDVLYITDDKMLDWINELILYLTGDLFYFNPVNSDENIQFLTLVKIKEKYT